MKDFKEQDDLYRELTKDLPHRKVITFNTIDTFIFDKEELKLLNLEDDK